MSLKCKPSSEPLQNSDSVVWNRYVEKVQEEDKRSGARGETGGSSPMLGYVLEQASTPHSTHRDDFSRPALRHENPKPPRPETLESESSLLITFLSESN